MLDIASVAHVTDFIAAQAETEANARHHHSAVLCCCCQILLQQRTVPADRRSGCRRRFLGFDAETGQSRARHAVLGAVRQG